MVVIPYFPWLMANPPAIPKLYYGAISQEQRQLAMGKAIAGMEEYLQYLSKIVADMPGQIRQEVTATIEQFEADIEEQIATLDGQLHDDMEALRRWVLEQTFSVQSWDVTRGMATDSVDAMRRSFFDVTIYGTTVDAVATSDTYTTVDELAASGWNCRALAVIGARVLDATPDMDQWTVEGGGGDGRTLDPIELADTLIDENGFLVSGR